MQHVKIYMIIPVHFRNHMTVKEIVGSNALW